MSEKQYTFYFNTYEGTYDTSAETYYIKSLKGNNYAGMIDKTTTSDGYCVYAIPIIKESNKELLEHLDCVTDICIEVGRSDFSTYPYTYKIPNIKVGILKSPIDISKYSTGGSVSQKKTSTLDYSTLVHFYSFYEELPSQIITVNFTTSGETKHNTSYTSSELDGKVDYYVTMSASTAATALFNNGLLIGVADNVGTETVRTTRYVPINWLEVNIYAKTYDYNYTIYFKDILDSGTYQINSYSTTKNVYSATRPSSYSITWTGITTPTKTGYTFKGWEDSNGITYNLNDTINITSGNGTATLYAVWDANDYIIYCNPNAPAENYEASVENIDSSLSVTYMSTKSNKCSVPTFPGYTFLGYYDAATSNSTIQVYDANGNYCGGTIYWDENGKWIYANTLKIYARWQKDTYHVYLTYYDTNGELISEEDYLNYQINPENMQIQLPQVPSKKFNKTLYVNYGWFEDEEHQYMNYISIDPLEARTYKLRAMYAISKGDFQTKFLPSESNLSSEFGSSSEPVLYSCQIYMKMYGELYSLRVYIKHLNNLYVMFSNLSDVSLIMC